MTINMNDMQINSISQIEEFLTGVKPHNFKSESVDETYKWITSILVKFSYYKLEKNEKSIVKKYLQKVTGYSRSQITRLVKSQRETGRALRKRYVRSVFSRKYSGADVILLAETDSLHETPNGKAIKKILKREFEIYGKEKFKRLSKISSSHIYNLRNTVVYKRVNKVYQKTKATKVNIGERRKPEPNDSPGFLRVDTVHQGDRDKEKGVYHINIVDCVTQFEFMGAVELIDNKHLVPMLKQLIELFPFKIIEVHADNGSEYINQYVAKLLNKLLIKLTKSRPRKSNDNALIESKNGSVIRKWVGYEFLEKDFAENLNNFYFGVFHEYINYHRPCAFPKIITDKKGKQRKTYPQSNYMTPFEKLKVIQQTKNYLKPCVTLEQLNNIAMKYSDNEMAELVQKERNLLFNSNTKDL